MRSVSVIVLCSLLTVPVMANDRELHAHNCHHQTKVIQKSADVIEAAISAPDHGIPRNLLEKAECIGVFPGVKKGAFVVGGEYGHGVFTCRQSDGTMGAPAFFTIGGPSIGWQFGGRSADMVLLIMNEDGVRNLLKDKFTLGGEASAVAGPVGRTAEASTDARFHAQILSWSRSRGAFLGAALEGMVLKPDHDATEKFYGHELSARKILIDQSVQVPVEAQAFVRTTSDAARRSG